MKRLVYFLIGALVFLTILPLYSVWAQTPAKTSLPKVPITYPGDTNETIIRRAQWVEEAKKEGTLDWFGASHNQARLR